MLVTAVAPRTGLCFQQKRKFATKWYIELYSSVNHQ